MNILGVILLVASFFGNVEINNYLYENTQREVISLEEEIQPDREHRENFIVEEETIFPDEFSQIFIQTPDKPPVPFLYNCPIDRNPLNGFIDDWGYCIPGLVTNASWFMKQPQYTFGTAVYYAPGIMKATANFREMSLEGYIGGVALLSPADIGETVWLRRQDHEWEGPFLSIDCGRRADIYTEVVITQEVVEVDFTTAFRWGLVSYSKNDWWPLAYKEQTVEVWIGKEKPSEDINLSQNPIYYAEWWLARIEFMEGSIDPSPYYYPNEENPEWDLRDGLGRRCLTRKCLAEQ